MRLFPGWLKRWFVLDDPADTPAPLIGANNGRHRTVDYDPLEQIAGNCFYVDHTVRGDYATRTVYHGGQLIYVSKTPLSKANPCSGCKHHHGSTYNGVPFVCAMHPFGPDGEGCPDFEGVPIVVEKYKFEERQ